MSIPTFLSLYQINRSSKFKDCFCYIVAHKKALMCNVSSVKHWTEHWFFARGDWLSTDEAGMCYVVPTRFRDFVPRKFSCSTIARNLARAIQSSNKETKHGSNFISQENLILVGLTHSEFLTELVRIRAKLVQA
ncbi:uncharacterized protein LOC120080500 [Benincasa hispida]|uniref:uncharacterized protein LOC120080500 n=1 Tax=Benincasa hispida TaxID=102211 RepID=UPI0019018D04|nr:uncharacterized protein LOC120080500 [Benincasa hispida]